MPDYKLSKIYKLESQIGNACYYGSTTNPRLSTRFANHRAKYKMHLAGTYHYVTSFEVLKHPDARILLVQNCPCDTKDELTAFESHYITNCECVNKNNPKKIDDMQQYKKEHNREYKEHHRERLRMKLTCGCGTVVSKNNISTHRKTHKHQEQERLHNELLLSSNMNHELAEFFYPIHIIQ